ncbi:MAG: hypothetical protein LBK23_07810 [Oscillospiraceae bacterium]|jgi:hypothetical protein|nr:hypothetical protein [Oscillospiraceae bacterium]
MKKACIIIGTLVILLTAGFIYNSINSGEDDVSPYDPENFMGDWVAVEYFYTSNVQMVGADGHLGNKIYLKPDSFYSDYLDGYPVIEVSGYSVEEQSEYDLHIGYKTWPSELGIADDSFLMLCMIKDYSVDSSKSNVGIIADADTLICNTGSGWYLYKRADADKIVEPSQSLPVLTLDPDYARALVVYDNFLRGGYGKRDENGTYTPAVAEGLKLDWDRIGDVPWEDYFGDYAVYDMNHDGIPELHVRPGPGHYTIYTYDKKFPYYYNSGPTVWTGWSYSSSYTVPLNNGATLGHRPGTYDSAASNFYTYSVYDFFGNEQFYLFLEVYDLDDDGVLEYYLGRDGDIEKYRLPKGLEEKIIEEVFLAKSDRIVWHSSGSDYINASRLEGEYNAPYQYSLEYETPPPEPGAPGLSENLRYPVLTKAYDNDAFICPVMIMTGLGSIDDMKDSLLDDEFYALPVLGDFDEDGAYDTFYTASKYDAPDSLWYDELLTKKEFLRALDLLLQKVTDAELLNVHANDGPVASYCEGGS